MKAKNIRYYKTSSGKAPFADWIKKLKDPITEARIFRRLDRLELGHYGDCKPVGDGVSELKMTFGAGYRIYFSEESDVTIILLVGGNKSTQSKDIKVAKEYWQEFKRRTS